MKDNRVYDVKLGLERIADLLKGKQLRLVLGEEYELILHPPFEELVTMTREELATLKRNLDVRADIKVIELLQKVTDQAEEKIRAGY